MNPITPVLGIDFGTSNSKMAWYNPRTNEAQIIRNAEGEEQTPSVVYFGETQTLVGSPAEEMLEYENERERVIISVKRELVTTPVIALPGKSVRAVEVAAAILRKLKEDAEKLHFRKEVTHAVITCPASFSPSERDKIREAGLLAGFGVVELLEEPVAAALAYAQMGLEVGNYVLVYDLGGGTFDLAVLSREDDGTFRPALEPQGITRCGGDDFDEALYNYCDQLAREKLSRPISLTGKRDLHFLSQCRQRKENLSNVEHRLFRSYLDPGAILFQYEIDRATFEHLISATVEETVRKTTAILEQADAQGQAVDTMVLIGGSSRVPLVQRLLEENLPVMPQPWQNRDVAVALGAAYYAHSKWNIVPLEPLKTQLPEYFTLVHTIPEHSGMICSVAFSPDGQILAGGSTDNSIKLWNLHTGELLHTLAGHANWVQSVAISPDGQTLASGSADNTINLWDLHTGELLLTLFGHSSYVYAVAISPDGQVLASGSADKTIKLWSLHTGELLHTIAGHSNRVQSVAINSEGQILASGSAHEMSRVWNPQSEELLLTLSGHSSYIYAVAISPDGQTLASGSDDQTIKVWNLHSGDLLHTLSGHSGYVYAVVISPDGQVLASGSADKTIKLWNLHTGGLLHTLSGHSGYVRSVAISPDGQTLVSGSGDNTIKLWNLHTGELLHTIVGHSGGVNSVAFSPDGQVLTSSSVDQTVKIWRKTGTA